MHPAVNRKPRSNGNETVQSYLSLVAICENFEEVGLSTIEDHAAVVATPLIQPTTRFSFPPRLSPASRIRTISKPNQHTGNYEKSRCFALLQDTGFFE